MRASKFSLPLLALILFAASPMPAAPTPLPAPSSANSLFKRRPIGPLPPPTPTPSPKRRIVEDETPVPLGWRISGIAAAALFGLALLYGAARAWRSSNLFDRQYRFPDEGEAAERLGGRRCGGHMATIRFDADDAAPSEPKDA
jgi:hypothetical protein